MINFSKLTISILMAILLGLFVSACSGESQNEAQGGEHGEEDQSEHESESVEEEGVLEVDMSADERQAAGVTIESVAYRALSGVTQGPGEVRLNLYRTSQVAPRIDAQVVERHAYLGDRIEPGAPLVTLSSVEMAAAQGALIVAAQEWERVRGLGRDVVSERRFVEAEIASGQAHALVAAYGMADGEIAELLGQRDASLATGAFILTAPQGGVIISDDFVIGEIADAGQMLFEISDESNLWVEAHLAPDVAATITVGADARIQTGAGLWIPGTVIQGSRTLDVGTRTRPVRIEVSNEDGALHVGEFVTAEISVGDTERVLAVPESAVFLASGARNVFVLEGDELFVRAVEVGRVRGGWIEITGGISAGEQIATSEVFLLKSLALRSQMGEGHGH